MSADEQTGDLDTGEADVVPPTGAELADVDFGGMPEPEVNRADPLGPYMRSVQRYRMLTAEEEKDLTGRYALTRDPKLAAKIVTANLRLVVKLAYEYRSAVKNLMDLVQEGNLGLMKGVEKFDPAFGVKLSSYAAWWIRAYILRFIVNNWRLVKLGTTQAQRKLFFNLTKEKSRFAALGVDPDAAEIARRLGVEERDVVEMDRRLSSGEASLDATFGDADGRVTSRLDMMPSPLGGPDAVVEHDQMATLVKQRMVEFRRGLRGKDLTIFDKRMAADEPLTLQELGDEFGVSRERVRQLEARVAHRLREYLKRELGAESVEA